MKQKQNALSWLKPMSCDRVSPINHNEIHMRMFSHVATPDFKLHLEWLMIPESLMGVNCEGGLHCKLQNLDI